VSLYIFTKAGVVLQIIQQIAKLQTMPDGPAYNNCI